MTMKLPVHYRMAGKSQHNNMIRVLATIKNCLAKRTSRDPPRVDRPCSPGPLLGHCIHDWDRAKPLLQIYHQAKIICRTSNIIPGKSDGAAVGGIGRFSAQVCGFWRSCSDKDALSPGSLLGPVPVLGRLAMGMRRVRIAGSGRAPPAAGRWRNTCYSEHLPYA